MPKTAGTCTKTPFRKYTVRNHDKGHHRRKTNDSKTLLRAYFAGVILQETSDESRYRSQDKVTPDIVII
jgi:hypothetical protein